VKELKGDHLVPKIEIVGDVGEKDERGLASARPASAPKSEPNVKATKERSKSGKATGKDGYGQFFAVVAVA